MDSLSVVISSPTHAPHKFTLDLGRQCSILELKEIIVTRLDTKLTIADQRLIFGGRILDDKETLDRVFDKVDCSSISPTIHLVVSHRHEPGQTQQQTPQHTSTTPTSPAPLRFRGNSDNTPSSAPANNNNTAATSGTNLNGFAFTPFTSTTSATVAGAHDGQAEADASNSSSTNTTAFSPFPSCVGGVPVMVPLAPQAMQYVLVNGMPYLVPAVYLPMLHYQQMQQTYGQVQYFADGTPFLPSLHNINNHHNHSNNPIADQARAGAAVAAADTPQQNAQEIAARDQRRAASLWLLMKLAFGIYLFGQNGSIERIVLLHIAALIIFLHQTGRLRIVRRIVPTPPADAGQGVANAVPGIAVPQPTPQTTTSTTTTTTTSTSTSNPAEDGATATSSSTSTSTSSHTSTSTLEGTTAHQQQVGGDAQAQAQETATAAAVQPRVSPWRSLEHALLTFVTSLVPAPQPDIDPAVAAAAGAGERGM